MTSLLDPSLPSSALLASYPSLRITSSSSIQGVVRSTLLHLSNPLSAPLLLHTLPSPSSSASTSTSTSTAIVPKNSHAGLHKLISIVEIVKREFEQHQKEAWREEDEKEAKRLKKEKRAAEKGKGKKRAREEDIDGIDNVNVATTSTSANVNGDPGDGIAAPVATNDNDHTKKADNKPISKRSKQRPLLRVYQYNILDCYERLPGASHGVDQDDESDDSESSSEEDEKEADEEHASKQSGDGEINDQGLADANGVGGDGEADEASQVERELLANPTANINGGHAPSSRKKTLEEMQLDAAITNRVKNGRKRPRKKHTPYMMIVLSTTRLPALEIACKKEKNKCLSNQLPAKRGRARSRGAQTRKGHKKRAEAEKKDATTTAAAAGAASGKEQKGEQEKDTEKLKDLGGLEVLSEELAQESGQGESEAAAVSGSSVMQAQGGQALS